MSYSDDDEFVARMKRFRALYQANIGTFPATDPEEIEEWFAVIRKVPLEQMRDFVLELSRVRIGHAKPLVPQCWRVYYDMFKPRRQYDQDQPPKEQCGLCVNTGFMWSTGRFDKNPEGTRSRFVPSCNPANGPLTTAVIPCVCGIGESRVNRHTDMSLRMEIHTFRESILPFEAKAALPDCPGTVEVMFANKVVRESHVQEEPEPVSAEPKPDVDEALALAMQAQVAAVECDQDDDDEELT